jgi:hypothetical protein
MYGLAKGKSLAGVLGVLQLNVRAKRFVEHFIGFGLRILHIRHGLFDTDDLIALRALAETMTGAVHFVPRSKPTNVVQLWFFHIARLNSMSISANSVLISWSRSQRAL